MATFCLGSFQTRRKKDIRKKWLFVSFTKLISICNFFRSVGDSQSVQALYIVGLLKKDAVL